ncbi:MAG: 2,3-bisphosphoglycerate-independent phosphoglycerate mutase, partial [Flavobacteriales bacterium]|nr:2,3-bisphosphoglycerate-independent phosphoglycerate mutase [Flavobacteriales bacterium]
MGNKKAVLMILDGWGHGDKTKSDAIYNANTPFVDSLYEKHQHCQLLTDGENVGLPKGQMGNSEVGHLNIGAGRIVYQDLLKINRAVESQELHRNPVLLEAIHKAKATGKSLHYFGLVSNGGVHSTQEHLHALCDIANDKGLEKVYIHAFTDGRDCDPKSGLGFLQKLEDHISGTAVELVSVIGRYYAMDRDKRWERVKKGYDLLVNGAGEKSTDLAQAVQNSYNNGVTDEFIEPVVKAHSSGHTIGRIKEGDVVVCFNFRTDRCREISIALTQQDFPEYDMKMLALHYVTMTNYDKTYKNVNVIFEKDNLEMTLGEVLQNAGKKQIRIAETE